MKIAVFTNCLNHHQVGLADKLYYLSGGQYMLIETESLTGERCYDRPYVLKAYAY